MAGGPSQIISSQNHHRRAVTTLVVAIVVFGLLILGYIYSGPGDEFANTLPTNQSSATQLMVATQLKQSPVVLLSDANKQKIVQSLAKSKATLSTSQKSDIISQLQAH
jgi:hypothetical protein